MREITKYPRTPHLEGSRLQPGDEDLASVPLSELAGRHLVVEEKLDGANAALRFDEAGMLWQQSRGHYLTGGRRELHFALFKSWGQTHREALWKRLGARYIVFGEWLFAKHTIFYDALPHYFLEFDVYDTDEHCYLSTPARRALLEELPIRSVPVLAESPFAEVAELRRLIAPALFKTTDWVERLAAVALEQALDPERILRETDPSSEAEGLYVKHEDGGRVLGRFKFIRESFLTAVLDSESHWLARPIVPNQLAPGVDVFDPEP